MTTPDRPTRGWGRQLLIVLMIIAVLAAIGLLLFYHRDMRGAAAPSDPRLADAAAMSDQIARQCAMGRKTEDNAAVSASLARYLSGLSAGATVKTSDVGALIEKITPNDSGVDFYKAYTDCLMQQTAILLNQRGIALQPPTAADLESGKDEEVRASISSLSPRAPKARLIQLLGQPILEAAVDGETGLTADFYQYKTMLFVADIRRGDRRVALAFATKDPINGQAMFIDQFRGVTAQEAVENCGGVEFTMHWNGISGACPSSHATGYERRIWVFRNYHGYTHDRELGRSCLHMLRTDARLDATNCPPFLTLPAMGVVVTKDEGYEDGEDDDFIKAGRLWIDIMDFGGEFDWWNSREEEKSDERDALSERQTEAGRARTEAQEIERRKTLVRLPITPAV